MQFRNFTRLVIISEESEVTREHIKLKGTRLIFYFRNGHEANGHEVNGKVPLKYSPLHWFCFRKMFC